MIAKSVARWILVLGLSLTPVVGCVSKQVNVASTNETPFIGSYRVNQFKLKNGLKLLVLEDHTSPTFSYHTWFNVGSRDEKKNYTGLAHLFEHMMFKGTQAVPAGGFMRTLDSVGANGVNAFTSHDYTAYVQELPKEQLDLVARLEADRMRNLIVNEESFKTEVEVVQNERRFRYENNPDGTIYQALYSEAFSQHPYRWPVIGYAEDLARMSAADAKAFYETHYQPNGATIIVVGDVDASEVLETVTKYYGTMEGKPKEVVQVPTEPARTKPSKKVIQLSMAVDKLMMGFPIPSVSDPDMAALKLLEAVLSNGKSSRLATSLINTGIASGAYASAMEEKDASLLLFGVNLQKGKAASLAEKVILKEIDGLQKSPLTDVELDRAKNQVSFLTLNALASNSGKARYLGVYEIIAGSFERGIQLDQAVQKITAQELQAVARKYLRPEKRVVIVGQPKAPSKKK